MRTAAKIRPRTKPAAERRGELMNAAQKLFLKQGVAPTTIEQITSAADVAKGTFYLHFSSKDDIRIALDDRFAQQLLARIKAAVAQQRNDDWAGKLAAWASACAAGYLASIRLHDVLFYGSRPPTRQGLVDNIVIDDLAALLKAGTDAAAWQVDDPRSAAVFIFSGHHGVVDDAYAKERRIDRARLALRLQTLCFRAVGL
jgi:AcrR family transcriptional regulator